jgi:hypothetical protein
VNVCMHAYVSMYQLASDAVRCNVQLAERFLYGNKLVLIHATTIFYALSR